MRRKGLADKVEPRGNKAEQELFSEVIRHYDLSVADLNQRIPDWNKKDELFRSWIDETKWPYNSVVFDPRVFTAIFEKTARLFANKPRGRMVPREGGDTLGAKINNELLSFQWDENERVDGQPMLAKWAMMDQNARKYGAAFGICKWRYDRRKKVKKGKEGKDEGYSEVYYDGPDFKVCVNRDVLANPSYSSVKEWFAYREYVTLRELESVNDAAKTKPVYKNLDILRDSLKKDGSGRGDTRASNWTSRNKGISNLSDTLGQDPSNKVVEVVTEYTCERWVTYAPKHGVILRDIPNPYDHGQIPVVTLKYYQIDDDLYGLSEIEPVERLQKATNALVNQYLDAINMSLYTPLKVRASGVQMHTLEFGPGAKWVMNDPATDVMPYEFAGVGVREFASTYRFMVGAMQEALGETSAAISSLDPGAQDKTATEVKDLATQRNARDNYNQIFLSEALKKQMMFWHTMNRQFMFTNPTEQTKVIRIVGKDALRFFQERGLDKYGMDEETMSMMAGGEDPAVQSEMEGLLAENMVNPQDFEMPQYGVDVDGAMMPKLTMEPGNEMGHLIITPDDLSGNYDYVPDVESMTIPNDAQLIASKKQMIDLMMTPEGTQLLAQDGYQFKFKEAIEDFFEQLGTKDADKYFKKMEVQNVDPTTGLPIQGGPGYPGAGGNAGMGGVPGAMAQGQAGSVVPGPFSV